MKLMLPQNKEALTDIEQVLKYADNGFYLFTTESALMQKVVAEELAGYNVAVWDYGSHNNEYFFGQLAEWAEQNENCSAFVVLNLQLALKQEKDVWNFNLSRDMLVAFPKPWFFGMNSYLYDILCTKAIDFFSYVRMHVAFTDENVEVLIKEGFKFYNYANQEIYDDMLKNYMSILSSYKEEENQTEQELISMSNTFSNIADLYYRKADYEKALEWFWKALSINEKILGKEHQNTAIIYKDIANVYHYQERYEEAMEYYKKALAVIEKIQGNLHPDTALAYNNIAKAYLSQKKYGEALKWSKMALNINEKILGTEHINTALSYNIISNICCRQEKYEEAMEWAMKELYICEKVLGREHPNTAITYGNIAYIYSVKRQYDEAMKWYLKELTINKKVYGKNHPNTVIINCFIAVIYFEQGDYSKSMECFLEAYQVFYLKADKEHYTKVITEWLNIIYNHTNKSGNLQFDQWLEDKLAKINEARKD